MPFFIFLCNQYGFVVVVVVFMTNECRAAFTERSTRSCTLIGNNIGARSLNYFCFGKNFSSRAIYLVFADLAFSGVKSLSRKQI
jgi:hypothetical protein